MKYSFLGFLTAMLVPSTVWAVSLPYVETFDAEPTCPAACSTVCSLSNGWVNVTTDDQDWLVHTGGTATAGTGPVGDHTTGTGNYVYLEAAAPCWGTEAQLISPDLDLTTGFATQLEFWFHMYGAAQGSLHVDIDPDGLGDGPWITDVIPPISTNQNLWQLQVVDLSPYVGSVINVRIRGITGPSITSDLAIDDVRVYNQWTDDVGVASIDGLDGCGLTSAEPIEITLENFGSNAQTMFDVSYSVDGGPPVVETFTGTVAPFSTATFTFATPADLSGPGPFDITANAMLATDQDVNNDSYTRQISRIDPIATFPSVTDFESGPGDWFTYGNINNTWAFGTPSKTVIQGASSGVNAWVNGGLTGNYKNGEQSFVQTLCGYDFTNLAQPAVRFRSWRATEANTDRVYLEVSVTNGTSWQVVGAYNDPLNWYNTPGGGWSGDSNGYITVAHGLQALAGFPSVLFRLRFSSDNSTVRNGFAMDDFEIFDNQPQLVVSDASPPPPSALTVPGTPDVLVQTLSFEAASNLSVNMNTLRVTLMGNMPETDIALVNLWLDNGDGVFDITDDMVMSSGMPSGGVVDFTNLAGNFVIRSLETAYLHVTFDISPSAGSSLTFGSTVLMETDVTTVSGIPVVFSATPLDGPLLSMIGKIGTLPWFDDFESVQTNNRTTSFAANQFYPIASGPGPVVNTSPSPSPNAGVAELLGQAANGAGGLITPFSGALMGALRFPNGGAAAAFDFWFDLSSYNVNDDLLYLGFWWNNARMNDHDLNNVFVSVDAGITWVASVHRWDFTSPVPAGWNYSLVDVSSRVLASGSDFSDSTVIRFQGFGLQDFGQDGLVIDDLWLGVPQYARLERVPGVYLPSGSIDGINGFGTGPITLTYTVTNASHLPLDILGDVVATNVSGASNITITPATLPAMLDVNESATFDVSFNADIEFFSFDLEFPTNDPRAENGVYKLTLIGEHGPRFELERLPGVPLANGSVDDTGSFAEGEWVFEYTLFNRGTVDMQIFGAPEPVALANQTNITVEVTDQPVLSVVPVGGQETFTIAFTGEPGTDHSFDMVIDTDDPDNSPYVLTVIGHTFADIPDAGPMPDAPPVIEPDAGMDMPDMEEGCVCKAAGAHTHAPPVGPLVLVLVGFYLLHIRRRRTSLSV